MAEAGGEASTHESDIRPGASGTSRASSETDERIAPIRIPPPQHARPGGHWSAANPIPTIGKFLRFLEQRRHEDEAAGVAESAEQVRPHAPLGNKPNRRRKVRDPTTGKDVEIDDVGREFMKTVKEPILSVPNANLGKETPVKTASDQPFDQYRYNQDITAPPDPIAEGTTSDVPIHGEKTNILFHPTPSIRFDCMFDTIEQEAIRVCVGSFLLVVFAGRLAGGNVKPLVLTAFLLATAVWLWMEDLIQRGRDGEWSSEQLRGQTSTANLLPESVEWINSFLSTVWGVLNPEMLSPIADTIEDIMQTSLPRLVENVRVAEMDQGSNPFRLLSIRSLPLSKEDQENMKYEHKPNEHEEAAQEAAIAEEEMGGFYNVECSFAYHARPSGPSSASKAANMHMLLIFYLGVRGLFGMPFPVFVELVELVGTVRLRVQIRPEPPYVGTVTGSLMGLPHVRAGCTPILKRGGVNILNIPVISNFVNYAIATAASMYVAPRSIRLDVGGLLRGNRVQTDTEALGVLWVRIRRARGLSKQDARGSYGGGSDPYINLSFSKYGKPMYCTRVITDDLNPVWEESAALLVTEDLLAADEQLAVELWDSDRSTADDIVGRVELPLTDLLSHPRHARSFESRLQGMDVGSEMPGVLDWEVGFYAKPRLRSALRADRPDDKVSAADGAGEGGGGGGGGDNTNDAVQGRQQQQAPQPKAISSDDVDTVLHTPPDPLWPSGIVSVIVHQIVGLSLAEIRGTYRHRKNHPYDPARNYGETTTEQSERLPTSYCTLLLNDTLVYRSRAKAVTSKPIFNAGTERFIRDWRSALLTLTIRDQRFREHDPILGIVVLRLGELLKSSSQLTRWYPIAGGIGFGHARISLLFRSVETELPPQLLGWDVGTFELLGGNDACCRIEPTEGHLKDRGTRLRLRLRTSGVAASLPHSACRLADDGSRIREFSLPDGGVRLPMRFRYRSAIVFEIHGYGSGTEGHYSVLWLPDYPDNTSISTALPIWQTKNGNRLTQNYITETNANEKRSPGLEDLNIVGRLHVRFRFSAGLDECHRRLVRNNDSRETFETWEACVAEGWRTQTVSASVPAEIEHLHDRSLLLSRDILRTVSPEEQAQWLRSEDEGQMEDSSEKKQSSSTAGTANEHDGEGENAGNDDSDGDSDDEDEGDSEAEAVSDREDSCQNGIRWADGSSRSTDRHPEESGTSSRSSISTAENSRAANMANRRTERRKQRGIMQWKPARNAVFARDEASFAMHRLKRHFGLTGREPDVETEVNR